MTQTPSRYPLKTELTKAFGSVQFALPRLAEQLGQMASLPPHHLGQYINQVQSEYARQWSVAANQHAAAGDYEWIVRSLDGYTRVLEVGTGDGTSTAHLVRHQHTVLSLDLNPSCLDAAKETLTKQKCEYAYHVRKLRREILPPDGFQVVYGPIDPFKGAEPQVLLLESDVLRDEQLLGWLKSSKSFDAVALWCIGAYGLRTGPTSADKRKYRIDVRGSTIRMASEVLRQGGIVQIVDRIGAMPNYADHQVAIRDMFLEIIGDLPLEWRSIDIREVDALTGPGGIPMKCDPSVQSDGRFALQSVLLTRK